MIAQFSLTVPEAKKIIAKGIANMSEVRMALEHGVIFAKGGTTVSAVTEELVGLPLRISGRITPRGAKTCFQELDQAHSIIIKKGKAYNVDSCLEDVISSLRPGDVSIVGANAIDAYGGAAMMVGRALGGKPGRILSGLMAQGVKVIVACGLEKMIPGRVEDIVRTAGLTRVDWSLGMAVGLMPIVGVVITEDKGIELLADVKSTVIGRGGVGGAEGGTTVLVEGDEAEVRKVLKVLSEVKYARHSGVLASFEECRPGSPYCSEHSTCVWKTRDRTDFFPREKVSLEEREQGEA